MGKFFTEDNKGGDAAKPAPKKPTRYFEPIDVAPAPAEEAKSDPFGDAGMFILDALRNANDSMTLGLYPKLLELTGLDPQAEEKLEDSNPWAQLIGQTGGMLLPTTAAANLVAKGSTTLAKHTLPAIVGREGIAGGAVSVAENAVDGNFDPVDNAIDAALGAAGAGLFGGLIHGTNRVLNPTARIRAAGSDLTPAERDAAYSFAKYAEGEGIPLTNAEAVTAMAPEHAPKVESLFEGAAKAPDASNVLASFNAGRRPKLTQAGRRIAMDIRTDAAGQPIDPLQPQRASELAQEGIDTVKGGFTLASRPYYAAAEARKLPPSWVPKSGYTSKAIEYVADNPALLEALERRSGNVPEPHSILFLDAAKKEMDSMVQRSTERNRGGEASFIAEEAADLVSQMDRVAPTYAKAREISEQGSQAVADLEAGPLGVISRGRNPAAQARSLFGATNSAEKEAAELALAHVGDELPLGLLANQLESATFKQPIGWAKSALPNEVSQELAELVLTRAGKDGVRGPLRAAQAVNPRDVAPTPNEHTGPIGELWSFARDWGKKGVAKKMLDPEMIRMMGIQGPLESALIRGTTAATVAAQGPEKRRRKKRKSSPK